MTESRGRNRLGSRRAAAWLVTSMFAFLLGPEAASAAKLEQPLEKPIAAMSIEELANLEVTTLSKRPESRFRAAGAVYVLTGEEIRRAGVRSIPEALRLVPGVEVARIDAHTWAISIRGFNSTTANKLLVLRDGRSVYTPLYSGVFWDVQDTLLEDVDRIEVVAGPGGALWGANAVNGIVNIITKSARETTGEFVELGAGSSERLFGGGRVGGSLGERGAYRVYGMTVERAPDELEDGRDAGSAWRMLQGGFRADWEAGESTWTAQGDVYSGGDRDGATGVNGSNLILRWSLALPNQSTLRIQAYWDHTDRRIRETFSAKRDTFDLDLQQDRSIGSHQRLTWGVGIRTTRDSVENSDFVTFLPKSRADDLVSAFVQDEIGFWDDRLSLTVGTKLEHNDYTGWEVQPRLALALQAREDQTLWAAVGRAVRTPSRLDSDLILQADLDIPEIPLPVTVRIAGNPELDSEVLLAYELGYRFRASERLDFDLAGFLNRYERLRSTEPELPVIETDPTPRILLPNHFENGLEGDTYGGTIAIRWQATPGFLVQPSYTVLRMDLRAGPPSVDAAGARAQEDSSPKHQARLAFYWSLPRGLGVFGAWRHVDDVPERGVGDYGALDLGLSWRPHQRLEVSLIGQSLAESTHREFSPPGGVALQRGAYGRLTWRF